MAAPTPDPFKGFWMCMTYLFGGCIFTGLWAMLAGDDRAMAWLVCVIPLWMLASIRARMDRPGG